MEPLQECSVMRTHSASHGQQSQRVQAMMPRRTHQNSGSYGSAGSQTSLRSNRPASSSVYAGSSFDSESGGGRNSAIYRNSQNLDAVLERLHSELGSFRLHGFRSLPLTQSNLSLQQQQQHHHHQRHVVGVSWRSNQEDADLMENIAELDSLLNKQQHGQQQQPGASSSSVDSAYDIGLTNDSCSASIAATASAAAQETEEAPVFSPAATTVPAGDSVNRGAKFRWSSFARSHRPNSQLREMQMSAMTAGQMQALRREAFRELNRIVREFCPPSRSLMSWFLPKLFKRQRSTADGESSDSTEGASASATKKLPSSPASSAAVVAAIFGVHLTTVQIRCGQPLPCGIVYAMRQLRRSGVSAHGIFRRAGGRARVQALKSQLDANPDLTDFTQCQPYDLADLVKAYLRELPECLITQKLSPTLMEVFTHVSAEENRLLAVQAAALLLPDENREVLQALLYFLNDFAECAETTQMGATNLAVCLAPSLFYFPHEVAVEIPTAKRGNANRDRLRRMTGVPDARDLADHRAATSCLAFMIDNCHHMFLVPGDMLEAAVFSAGDAEDADVPDTSARRSGGELPSLDDLAPKDSTGKRHCFTFADNHRQMLARESSASAGKWQRFSHRCGVETFSKDIADGCPLKLWKACVFVDADAIVVLNKIVASRPKWDPDVLTSHLVETIDENADVTRFGMTSAPAQPARESCVLRTWRSDSSTSHRLHASSVKLPPSHLTMQIHVLTEDWLIEQQQSSQSRKGGRCRVTLVSRVDLKGRTVDWYSRTWGHTIARLLVHLKKSFHSAS